MVDDDDQIAVAPLVGDLVDPDTTQPIEPINSGIDIGQHAGDD
jgi:hypothetical protein